MNKKNSELISVIIPCFNSGDTLPRTIESILNQSWENKEIIVVNDGSTEPKTKALIDPNELTTTQWIASSLTTSESVIPNLIDPIVGRLKDTVT